MIVEVRDEVVSLSGVLRRDHWNALESAVRMRLRHHPNGIVINCSGLEMVTPEGAETFRKAVEHIMAREDGPRVVVAAVPPQILRVLRQIPNLSSQVPMAATVEEARRSLGLTPGGSARGVQPSAKPTLSSELPPVLVGLLGSPADAHATAVGCRLALARRSRHQSNGHGGILAAPRLHLIYLLEVPRDRPLLSALGPEEESAVEEMNRYEQSVRVAGVTPVARLERTRNAAARLTELAEDLRAEVIVLSLGADASSEAVVTVSQVVASAPCGVYVDRLPLAPGMAVADSKNASSATGERPTNPGRLPAAMARSLFTLRRIGLRRQTG